MADSSACPCPGEPAQPSRGAGSKELPAATGGTSVSVIAGQHGKDVKGNPVTTPVSVGSNGGLNINLMGELPTGVTGTLVIDNVTQKIKNGRIISISTSGSGSGSWTPSA